MGRSSKIDEAMPDLLAAIERGLSYKSAAHFAGISARTFYLWRDRGEKELDRLAGSRRRKMRKREKPFVEFVMRLREAEAEAETVLADVMKIAAIGGEKVTKSMSLTVEKDGKVVEQRHRTTEEEIAPDWRAAMAILERRYEGWQKQPEMTMQIDEILDYLDENSLERIANGEHPLAVIAAYLAKKSQE